MVGTARRAPLSYKPGMWRVGAQRISTDSVFKQRIPNGTASRSRRRFRASFALTSCPWNSEGAGNAGRLMRPQPRVQCRKAHELVTTVTPEITRHSPRNGFNGVLRALPGDRAFLSPSSADIYSANLTPASRRQDHTTSPSAGPRPRLWRRQRPPHPAPRPWRSRAAPL